MLISAKELAQKLNVSAATVSMVLNNKPGISKKTRELVQNAAIEYGYEPPPKNTTTPPGIIQFIIYKKHGTIVADNSFFSQVIEGIVSGCKTAGYELNITYFYENENVEEQLLNLTEQNRHGILLLGTEMTKDSFSNFFEKNLQNLPMVVLDTYFEELNCDSVLINNVQGAYKATNYLIEQGISSIGYLRSSCSIGNFSERADGYYKALRKQNIPTDHPYVHKLTPTMEGAYNDMMEILKQKPPLAKGYFADNDFIAAGAMRAFLESGYRIPEDVSIIGFDDIPLCDFLAPALTTMTVPKQRLGELAVERLVAKIAHPQEAIVKTEISVKLHERSSVKKD